LIKGFGLDLHKEGTTSYEKTAAIFVTRQRDRLAFLLCNIIIKTFPGEPTTVGPNPPISSPSIHITAKNTDFVNEALFKVPVTNEGQAQSQSSWMKYLVGVDDRSLCDSESRSEDSGDSLEGSDSEETIRVDNPYVTLTTKPFLVGSMAAKTLIAKLQSFLEPEVENTGRGFREAGDQSWAERV
jgi:hypothetical protein